MFFLLLASVLLSRTLTFLVLVGGNSGWGEIKMVSASTTSAIKHGKDVILVHAVQLKPNITGLISGRMISRGISDVAIVSVYFETACQKK